MILRLAMIGFGNVGQEFARLLLAKRDWLLKQKGLDVEILAISTKSRGSLISERALDLEKVLKTLSEEGNLRSYGPEQTDLSPARIIDKCKADMMIELTTLNTENGQPAIDHITNALESGMDVVTANKGPIAFAYDRLRSLSRSRGVHFRFEGTVMDGTPIFNLVERTLPGAEILGLEGILNSTSNYVLSEMSNGKTMDQAITEARKRGFAEADPSLDIDGWDAAVKITALANVLMGASMDPHKVERKGIRDIGLDEIKKAASKGKKMKMIARASIMGEKVALSVRPELVSPESPFWAVDGTSSAVTIRTDLMGDITLVENNPPATATAYAVFSDMLLIVEAIRAGTL
jgi:homoserine dehydrogenase